MCAVGILCMVSCTDLLEMLENLEQKIDDIENQGGGEEENEENTGEETGTEATTRISGFKYYWKYTRDEGYDEHTVTFGSGYDVEYHIKWDWPESEDYPGGEYTMKGTYTYENEVTEGSVWQAEGTMTLTEVGNESHTHTTKYYVDSGGLLEIYRSLPSGGSNANLDRVRE